jgi:branched-chain amino acid transport system permease protein
MQGFIAQIINGLSTGSIYVLLVTGFNLLLLVAMIIHFSYPQVVVFSMYITWLVIKVTGGNIILGILAGIASSVAVNLVSAPLFQKVMQKRDAVDINSTMVLSMGLGMIITGGSDFHGEHIPQRKLGRTSGGREVPDAFLDALPFHPPPS